MFDADFIKGFEIGKAYRKNLLREAKGAVEQRETVAEGTLTTEVDGFLNGCSAFWFGKEYVFDLLSAGMKVRLTVNGVSDIFTVTENDNVYFTTRWFGNIWLEAGIANETVVDSGYDYLITTTGNGLNSCYLYSRTPGTYNVKIERLVTA